MTAATHREAGGHGAGERAGEEDGACVGVQVEIVQCGHFTQQRVADNILAKNKSNSLAPCAGKGRAPHLASRCEEGAPGPRRQAGYCRTKGRHSMQVCRGSYKGDTGLAHCVRGITWQVLDLSNRTVPSPCQPKSQPNLVHALPDSRVFVTSQHIKCSLPVSYTHLTLPTSSYV